MGRNAVRPGTLVEKDAPPAADEGAHLDSEANEK
jgi:hypothetical protein